MRLKHMDTWKHNKHWSLKQYNPRPEQQRIIDEITEIHKII